MSTLAEDAAELGLTGPFAELRLKIWATTQMLAPFLRSPERSPLCAACLVKVTHQLLPLDADSKFCIRLLRTDHRACLEGLIHFVAIPRTEEQLGLLEARLSECRCDLTAEVVQLIHDNHNDREDLTFNGMVSAIFTILSTIVFHGLKVGHVVGAQLSNADSTTRKWPANTAALFPAGPDAAVLSFARLFWLTKSHSILDFTRVLLPHCPSMAISISKSTLFWEAALRGLQSAVDAFHTDPLLSGAARPSDSVDRQDLDPHGMIKAFLMFLTEFIPTFTESLRQQFSSAPFIVSHGRKIYDLHLKVLRLATNNPSPNHEDSELTVICFLAAGMATCIGNALPSHQRPTRTHSLILRYSRLQQESEQAFTRVFSLITRITAVVHCCNAGCSATSESSAQKLRYCARCRVMRYCSSVCQKAAWREHKGVCADLKMLNKLAPTSIDESAETGQCLVDFETEAKKVGFTAERMLEIATELTDLTHFQNAG
ncbi:hypothetical protein C8R44DRAFT_877304 [Mycena epipterygia]|nr:hypothetical protein C8R44DRAFT_877304 [Mycena epipterygia]